MSRKFSAPVASLAEQSAAVAFQLAAGRTALRALLLQGSSTVSVRGEITAIELQADQIADQIATAADAAQVAETARLIAYGETLAAGARNRIEATLAALAPPAAPWLA